MENITWWDEYEVKARYIPTFISVVPFGHFLTIFLGLVFWESIISSISWMCIVESISISFVAMITLVQIQCGFSKIIVEESVFGRGGKLFPTTDMLLYNGGLISIGRKEQIRNKITDMSDCSFSTKEEEDADPENARLAAREAVGYVKKNIGKGIMVLQCNIRYGFFRNLIGGIIWASIGSAGCAVIYAMHKQWAAMTFFAVLFLVYLLMYIGKKHILKRFAFIYADTLFDEFIAKKYKIEQ